MNMGVNKVDLGDETLVDLTQDSVTPQSLLQGYSAHNKAGELIEGLLTVPTKVSELENDEGFLSGNKSATIKSTDNPLLTLNRTNGNYAAIEFQTIGDKRIRVEQQNVEGVGAKLNVVDITDGQDNLKTLMSLGRDKIQARNEEKGHIEPIAFKSDIKPLTTSLAVTEEGTTALDGTVGKVLNDKINEVNSNLASGQIEFKIEDGKGFWRAVGADAWNPFSSDVTHTVYAKAYLDVWNSGRTLNAQLFVDGSVVAHSNLDVANYVNVGNAGTGKRPEISTGNRLI